MNYSHSAKFDKIGDLVNYSMQDDEEGPAMTVKEIEERKRIEKELQQKKVCYEVDCEVTEGYCRTT